jgi:hypothetical protein
MDDYASDPPPIHTCPHCGQPVTTGGDAAGERFTCPACGGDFFVPADGDEPAAAAARGDDAEPPPDRSRADELSGLRIRQLANARRAAYRARSYAVVAFAVCQVGAIQLVINAIAHARAGGWGQRPTWYVLLAVACEVAAVYFARQALAFHREAKRSALPEPTAPPEFGPLSDGSQQWKNFDRM